MLTHPAHDTERTWLDLSLAQQAVWLDAKLSDASDYQLGGWARITLPVDADVVRQSVRLIMARHDGLRLRVDDELPRQWVDDSMEPPFRELTLEAAPGEEDAAFQAHVDALFATPMPLGDHPLFAIELVRVNAVSFVLWRFHHLIADSYAVAITRAVWFDAYEALASGAARELAPPSSYLPVIEADKAYLDSVQHQRDLGYWTDRFEPLPPPLISDLAPKAQAQRASAGHATWVLEGDSLRDFEAAAKRARVSTQRALFGLFAVTLGRRYGQMDLVTGMALHRRDATNRGTIGMLSGVIPVRCRFEPHWVLEECLQAYSEQMDDDLRHQRLPVDVLSRALGLAGVGRAGLFEAVMSYIPAERKPAQVLAGITGGAVNTREASPISLHVEELGGGLHISVAVNPDFLDRREAATLLDLLHDALTRFVDDADTRFIDIAPASAGERAQVVSAWNATGLTFPSGTLDGLFAAQVQATPGLTAVVDRDGSAMTYAELDAKATRVAQALCARGVAPEVPVGVCLERSADTIVSLLGILKAGGVYVPLDPAYPVERRDFMIADAKVALVIESVDALLADTPDAPVASIPHADDPRRLAYIIYTSGTTGTPKGVAVPHAAAVNLAFARRAAHDPIGPGDRVLGGIAVGFDVSIGQLLLPLLAGATVVIAPDLRTLVPEEFWALVVREGVTHINSVPSFLASILDAAPRDGSVKLSRLMLGGEALTGALVARIRSVLPDTHVVNMYGPTETCIDATYHVASEADQALPVLPIGRPLGNYTAYVLDDHLEPVGVGVAGELYVGGAGLARGYVNAPTLTAARFVADPFSATPGARMYRTGDRARWRADGCIEFLGRVDQQLKIRGFRVEPEEIAAVLLEHDGIAQAVVVPRAAAQAAGAMRLVAYVVPAASDAMPAAADLRTFLAGRLPDYMVPSAYVGLSALPITRNGKLDLQALPSPDEAEDEYVAPRTPTEALVAELYADILGLRQCSATGHFFLLGGHSLLATSLVARLRAHGHTVPLRTIFEAPTVEALARVIDGDGAADVRGAPAPARFVPAPRPAQIPLSFSQERIWFVERLQDDASYNIPIAFELEGALDVSAVRGALDRIVARHEALRTLIAVEDGRPVQRILPTADVPVMHEALDDATATLQALARHRFDLARDIPLAARLVSLPGERHVLGVVVHHVAFDGWSAGLFLQEFAESYAQLVAGSGAPERGDGVQFADFAIWQRAQDRQAELAYWMQVLHGAPPRLELPVRTGPAAHERAAGVHEFTLDAALHAQLRDVATANGASLFMVLHAAYASLLSRWSGQDDVVIGTVTANRTEPEFEAVIGCFVNTLALRTTLRSGEAFTQLLHRVKDDDLAAYAHQDVPFEQLVAAIQPDRSLEHTPIFQVMLVLQNAPAPVAQMPGLTLRPVHVPAATPKFDLTLSLTETDGALAGTIEFATDRHDAAQMARFARQFERLLAAVAEDPTCDLARVEVLDPEERSLVVDEWNRTARVFPTGTLDGLFRAQAQRTPQGIALVDSDGAELTYAALDAASDALARTLVDRGVQPGDVVGVQMPRSNATVISLLAILKAGGIYLPLDPAYPAERREYMLADSGARVVLTEIGEIPASNAALPDLRETGRAAYIIYTSGTTGRPKGVAVPHGAAVNMAYARLAGQDPIGPGDRVFAGISVGFDVSVGQLLLPLLSGATITIASELRTMGAEGFWEFIVRHGVTHINSVPSFFEFVIDAAPPASSLKLVRVMLGGEPLTSALVARIQRVIPGVEVANIYGPTEATIEALYHVATPADAAAAELPIGRPHANYQAYVLDANMLPVGVGIAGELYLGGAGLAIGYVNAPELTAARFVPNPFGAGRLYKTGDRARWRADGRVEFLGRVDEQVKIRGFRVEPGEIEARLRAIEHAGEAAVIADNGRLLAYFTGTADVQVLRSTLAESLPDYMVPAAFVQIPALPLTTNGKLDRRALPRPGQDAFARREHVAPVGETEDAMAALWSDLLGVEQVGRHDNFFELGGHSLLAVTLIERMRERGLPGDVRALFTTPTIAGLAAAATTADEAHVAPPNGIPAEGCDAITPAMLPLVRLTQAQVDGIVASVPGGAANVQDIYPLAPLQEGILFQHLMTAEGDPYLTPFLLGFDSGARVDAFLAALQAVATRHDVLRTALRWQDLDAPVQVVLREAPVPVERSSASTAEELLAEFDPTHFRIPLDTAPLLRAVVARDMLQGRWLVLLLTHHLVLDHTSMDILVHEIRTLMRDPQAVLPPSLPYRNFVAQARAGVSTSEHEAYFRAMLGDVEDTTAPFGLRDVQQGGATTEHRAQVDAALAAQLREQAARAGVSVASLFHLAWAVVLGQLASTDDVTFGTILFGRMRSGAGADRVVGMFINTLPVRLQLAGTTVQDGLMRAQTMLADLLAHEHAPLALVQRVSGIPAPAPLFASLFNYRHSPQAPGGSTWDGVEIVAAAERTNYPLAMAVDDLGDGFLLTALAQPGADPALACACLDVALRRLAAADPSAPLTSIEVLPASARTDVVETWNDTWTAFPTGTLESFVAVQARQTPEAAAVIGLDGEILTYAALDARATAVARALVAQGVAPGSVVGVRMPRSTDTVIALLAVLKAGGIYLPLDPAYPPQRLEYMVKDAGATLVLESLDGLTGNAPLPRLNDPARTAYIIYTSGTTGLPKGVAMSHAAAVNLTFARRMAHDPIGHGDRVLAAISVGFDVSIGQLLLPLVSGSTIVIAGELKSMGAQAFWDLVSERKVTHINSVPSFIESVLEAAPAPGTLALRMLMLGGEALSGTLVARLARVLPGVTVVNMYGPTEACIDATFHVATEADHDADVLPIGRPLPNYTTYVLTPQGHPAGVGVEGELLIGGQGLAEGYVNAPAVTAERFVRNPFGEGRLYRTGDRARWRADGRIEFLGRRDTQVKIRGFRVEPGEVEAQLRKADGVREAAVIARQGRLLAYVTGEQPLAPDALRAALTSVLPDYMVPSAFVQLPVLPLTPNGKLDRAALPEPGADAVAARDYAAPIGPVELAMERLWASALQVERVGRHDNFFELGGHSLLAVGLVERMRQQGLPGDVRALFATPTIAGLAAAAPAGDAPTYAPENGIAAGAERITPDMLPMVSLTQRQLDEIVAGVPGGAANVQDIYPLSPLQEGLLFQHLITAEGDPYITPYMLGFDRRARLDEFVRVMNQVIARHDVLRTAMHYHGLPEPVQVVRREAALPVEEVRTGEHAAAELMDRFSPATYRLDLTQAPLLRAIITHDVANDRWLLLLLTHHLILDHTSMEILVHELRTLMTMPDAVLPPSEPYRNFIAETRSTGTAAHEAFFTDLLGSVDEPTAPYGLVSTQGGGDTNDATLTLDTAVSQRLREAARRLGVTPATLFHVAWARVIGHVASKTDVVFGTIMLGRMRAGANADKVVGMFINTLPMRVDLAAGGVVDTVRTVHQLLTDLMAHEHAPLALTQKCSGVAAPTPLFSSLFNFRYSAPTGDDLPAWEGVQLVDSAERTNYPLSMAVDDLGDTFLCSALAQRGADPWQVCAMLEEAVKNLLAAIDGAPGTSLQRVEVLPAHERLLVRELWNDTAHEFPHGSLDALFARQAARTPGAVAVAGVDGTVWTYAELQAESTRVARGLVAAGITPGAVVGVRMPRSAETIIALLGILKAGAVYLPLDPAYPADRLEYMIADAGAALVLEEIDSLMGEAPLPARLDPDRLAYIIYTSGTTGRPKGVAVRHGAAVNLAFARCAAHDPIGEGDRVLAQISVGFDVSIGQLLLPLLSGATVVVAGDLRAMSPAEFWQYVSGRRITHINSVPSFIDSTLAGVSSAGPLTLRRLMVGGEALTGTLVTRLRQALPDVTVVNMYGPTETCIDATYHVTTPADATASVVPIGKPLPNYSTWILDEHQQPVGIGVAGELYIGGLGLASHYVNADEMTAARFVPDPFADVPGARLYRTGDRARWRADGSIEFLGRMDQQVKIRGFRVEPEEIASVLATHEAVEQAVVIARGGRLAGYVVPRVAVDTTDLRMHLAQRLPDYMVPASITCIERIPVNRNGKLDVAALPRVDEDVRAEHEYAPPQTATEHALQREFQAILGRAQVSREDNFFELGGDSLAAMRLVNAVQEALGVQLPMRWLFESPTIAALGAAIDAGGVRRQAAHLVPLQPQGVRRPIFCVHPAGGHVFCYLPLARALGTDQPLFALQASGLEEHEAVGASIEQMAADYVIAIRTQQPVGPYRLLGMSSGGLIAFEMAQQLRDAGEVVEQLVLLDTTVPGTEDEASLSDAVMLRAMAAELGVGDLLDDAPADITLPELVARAHASGRLPQDVSLAHVERIERVFRNTVRAHTQYRPAAQDGPMLLVRATQRLRDGDALPDWSSLVSEGLEVLDIECGHADLVSAPLAPTIAALLAYTSSISATSHADA